MYCFNGYYGYHALMNIVAVFFSTAIIAAMAVTTVMAMIAVVSVKWL